jgi:catechol 2,3-dioxygenase-like lactoylglutathione lyase family enzyme
MAMRFLALLIVAAGVQVVAGAQVQRRTDMPTVWIRYIVADVDAAITFYGRLGFKVDMHPAPGFAALSRGDLQLLLNTPAGAGGASQPMPDGSRPQPGGWNRMQLRVADLAQEVDVLKRAGAHFRNDVVVGNGGKQILLEDPSGNPIELFEPAPR